MNNTLNKLLWIQRIIALILAVALIVTALWTGDGTAAVLLVPLMIYLIATKDLIIWGE